MILFYVVWIKVKGFIGEEKWNVCVENILVKEYIKRICGN